MPVPASSSAAAQSTAQPLGDAALGFVGTVRTVAAPAGEGALPAGEIERRLIELGFVEGVRVEILHQGLFGRDPIAVRVDGMTIALRRRDAAGIMVDPA
ncbi:MAG TPA: FeoA family protein [Stellaceae bacterium]|jgi:ferrous iron transport protein A|nr:FeoA family protein [Stellaceae bacterium]